ncbi:MAG TPA: acyl-CoA dehydrogenase family protein [Candidatus Binataceae bacterium]|nr:acyl-CoA dehydrogenase family protein [Candidatus Binataceae bacterium]
MSTQSARDSSIAKNGSEPKYSRREMVERAAAMVPMLRERAAECEKLRQVPKQTVADFMAAEFHRISQPVPYGGIGLDMDSVYECAAQLGRGCGSSGWMGSFWPLHNWMMGLWPKQAQDEYWADSLDVLSSTASATVNCRIEPAKGGVRLTGKWNFASGIDHAAWVQLIITGPDKADMILVPKKDFRIDDNWHVLGLCGSGSKGLSVDDVFIPEHRICHGAQFMTGTTAGSELYGSAFYKLPIFSFIGYSLAAPIIGMAQGVVDLFEQQMQGRRDGQTGVPVIEQPMMQVRLAESSAEVDAVRLLMLRDLRHLREYGEAGGQIPIAERARMRRDISFAVRTSVRAANRLFEGAGAHAIYQGSPIQRLVRDINAASHSLAITWDVPAENYGRVRWGLPPNTWQL